MSRLVVALTTMLLVLTGCADSSPPTVVAGRAVSMLYDPGRVGGLPAANGPSGPRGDVPPVTARLGNSDGGQIDRLALLAIDDIEDFWTHHYGQSLRGRFTPVSTLVSYDSTDPNSPAVCGGDVYHLPNAMYCRRADTMAWDRAKFMPTARKYFGDMAINGTLAHEYGHALQAMAHIVNPFTRTLVREQQADCFAGVYLQWVAAGKSSRAQLSTGGGLNHVLAGLIVIRDPVSTPDNPVSVSDEHGTALDRVGAFQTGFDGGAEMCAQIDTGEIRKRRGNLPRSLFDSENPQSDLTIDEGVLSTLTEQLGQIFGLSRPPKLATSGKCPSGHEPDPVAYCPETDTIVVDMPGLQDMSAPTDQSTMGMPQGDNTGLSAVTSRYALAVQSERGVGLESATAALRTACLTGVAQRRMAEPMTLSSGPGLTLAGGDLDEAVTGLLMNGIVASDVDDHTVPAGFTRILAFRSGLHGDIDGCFERFP
ncbi:neutral zinc metallopeptidase [Mycolicibacter sinensis]|uniref:Peptidase n=1 Tax=Mycolicibacter sinensis (strain JDM601) TaxID=875328 RepID=A0A1A2EF47_MYCSD|nr:neutral zinc metallopeptidase [Mycolicibacter sinensis]OBG04178.1 peptidase [Mycolicibacter sinensis]OBG06370.1 peptidase [Mycolicibacter sinensis]